MAQGNFCAWLLWAQAPSVAWFQAQKLTSDG